MGLLEKWHEDIGMALQVFVQRGRATFWRANDEEIRLGPALKGGGMERGRWKRHRLLRRLPIRYQWIIVQNSRVASLPERRKARTSQTARDSCQLLTACLKIW